MRVEFRIYVQIPGVSLEEESSWERLIDWLEHTYRDLGPVLSWDDRDTARITLAATAEDLAAAAEVASSAVSQALHATGLGMLYPRAIEVEPIDTPLPAPA